MLAAAWAAHAADAPAKFATDEALRSGMVAIRDLVRTNHSLVTHRRMPPDHAARFARQIRVEADQIRAKSRISGEARARLEALLADIVAGVEAVAKPAAGSAAIDGIVRADEALARYPAAFDHPGWAPLQALP
jgi:hypothetical protein